MTLDEAGETDGGEVLQGFEVYSKCCGQTKSFDTEK
jgi:hypothetical protein